MKKEKFIIFSVFVAIWMGCGDESSSSVNDSYVFESSSSEVLFSSGALVESSSSDDLYSSSDNVEDKLSNGSDSSEGSSSDSNDSGSSNASYESSSGSGSVEIKNTLQSYVEQFTSDGTLLAFDTRTLAYNTDLPLACEEIIVSYDDDEVVVPVELMNDLSIKTCFPSAAILVNQIKEADANCAFYAIVFSTGESPLGAVLTNVSESEFEITLVKGSGENCIYEEFAPNSAFLVEDCSGQVNESAVLSWKTFISDTWTSCKIDEQHQLYGEWVR